MDNSFKVELNFNFKFAKEKPRLLKILGADDESFVNKTLKQVYQYPKEEYLLLNYQPLFDNKMEKEDIEIQTHQQYNSTESNKQLLINVVKLPASIKNDPCTDQSSSPIIKLKTQKKTYQCLLCSEGFYQMIKLDQHRYIKHNIIHDPTSCDPTTVKKNKVTKIKSKNKEALYECSYCPKTFIQKGNMQTHERIHTGYYPFKCVYCQKSFHQLGNLNQHMFNKHSTEEIASQEESFKSDNISPKKKDLKIITNSHKNKSVDKRYCCSYCSKTFSQKANMKIHENLHTEEVLYKCSVCLKSFHQLNNLNKHVLKKHPFQLPLKVDTAKDSDVTVKHKCKFCYQKFNSKYDAKSHERQHIIDEHKCIACSEYFQNLFHLKNHLGKCGKQPHKRRMDETHSC